MEGTAGLTIVTNDGGTGGDLMIYPGGKVNLWDINSSLIINGNAYVLVSDLATLASDITANPQGFYALVKDDDAKHHRYRRPPILDFFGTFEGLGNSIANLEVKNPRRCGGMFASAGAYGKSATIRDFILKNVKISSLKRFVNLGALVGCSYAAIINASASGNVSGGYGAYLGGLVGNSSGTISRSHSAASVVYGNWVGGLVGTSSGIIDQSYATGKVIGNRHRRLSLAMAEIVTNSYATGAVEVRQYWGGGLVGSVVTSSANYSTGNVLGGPGAYPFFGGFMGYDYDGAGNVAAYWDLDTSGISDPSQGAGNIANDPGITGLTDAQLKSGLPAGFDPKIWGQSASINNGYPYLLANPPPQ